MAIYKMTVIDPDGSKRSFETTDGARAMNEAASCTYPEKELKTVTLEKDGDVIWSEKIKQD